MGQAMGGGLGQLMADPLHSATGTWGGPGNNTWTPDPGWVQNGNSWDWMGAGPNPRSGIGGMPWQGGGRMGGMGGLLGLLLGLFNRGNFQGMQNWMNNGAFGGLGGPFPGASGMSGGRGASYPGGIGNYPYTGSPVGLTGIGSTGLGGFLPGADQSYWASQYNGPTTTTDPAYGGGTPGWPSIPAYPGGGAYWDYGTSKWITPSAGGGGSTPSVPGISAPGGNFYPTTGGPPVPSTYTGTGLPPGMSLQGETAGYSAPGGNFYPAVGGSPVPSTYTGTGLPPGVTTANAAAAASGSSGGWYNGVYYPNPYA